MPKLLGALSAAVSRVPALKRITPAWMRRRIYDRLLDMEISYYPDRLHMREVILPLLGRRAGRSILNVGCRRYSVEIGSRLAAAGKMVSTIDIDPAAARWGSQNHVIGDATFLDEYFEPGMFDAVILNGVLGYGINAHNEIDRTFLGLSRVIKPGGILVLGWNADRIDDPIAYDLLSYFCQLPEYQRVTFKDSTHNYEWFERNTAAGPASAHPQSSG